MSYFKNFPIIKYKFGNQNEAVFYKDISVYVDLIDQLSDQISYYANYTILDGDRPDTLAYKLYRDVSYYWTFFLLNEKLREQGWPLSNGKAYEFSEKKYPNYAVQIDGAPLFTSPGGFLKNLSDSNTVLAEILPVGSVIEVQGTTLATAQAEVVRKNLDIGQVILKYLSGDESVMTNIRAITYIDTSGDIYQANLPLATSSFYNTVVEYNAPMYYKNSAGDRVDIDPYDIETSTSALIPVTYQENLIEQNDDLKIIRVFKKSVIDNIVSEFNRQLKS